MSRVDFVALGNPIPKQRARVAVRGRVKASGHTPQRTRAWQAWVAWHAKLAMRSRPPFVGPVGMTLRFYRENRRRADGDNLEKAVSDAMNGIVYLDDDQVVECHRYRDLDRGRPRVEVEVWEIEEGNNHDHRD